MSDHPKDIRKQVRNVTQEILPQILQSDVFQGLYKNLQAEMNTRLTAIEKDIKIVLSQIDNRSKDTQTFIMNQIQQAMVPEVKKEEK